MPGAISRNSGIPTSRSAERRLTVKTGRHSAARIGTMSCDDFSVWLRVLHARTIVRVVGELDIATMPMLTEVLESAPGPVTIDADQLTFLDACALGALARADQRKGVSVRHARPHCRRIFELCGLEGMLAD